MGRRALVIGIEDYPSVSDGSIAAKLPGTLDAALRFRDWLLEKWTAERIPGTDRQIVFCSEPTIPGGRRATLDDIHQALLDIRAAGQNSTEEFYFFFSGHGFTYVAAGSRADQLIAANYRSMQLAGASACLNLDKMVYWLRQELGPGKQYYFIDACRNELDGTQIAAGTFGLPNNPQTTGEATTFVLQSTVPGATAAADGRFSKELMEGLKGRSTAKTWDDADEDTMVVRYDTLRMYVTDRMKKQPMYNKVEGEGGEADGIIARLKPAPTSRCELRIEGAKDVTGFVELNGRRTGSSKIPLAGEVTHLVLKPDRYRVRVDLAKGRVSDNDRPVLLFDDDELIFQVERIPSPMSKAVSGTAPLSDVVVPPKAYIELREINTGEIQTFDADTRGALPGGRYSATMRDRDSRLVSSNILDVESGRTVDLTDWTWKAAQASIASSGFEVVKGAVDFSESLDGPLEDPDLNVWLAVVGAGRILNGISGRYFSKIGRLALHDFRQEPSGASPLYVLAGFDDPNVDVQVAVSDPNDGATFHEPLVAGWQFAQQPLSLAGVRELYVARPVGPQLVSFRVSGQSPYTIASLASANRATLITLTLGSDGELVVAQYLLPLGERLHELHPFVQGRLQGRNALADVKTLAQAVRAFRSRRDVQRELPDLALDGMLYMKWVDPIATALSAYELVRRGKLKTLPEVVRNLQTYFPDLPDGAALARLAGISRPPFTATPLFLDGLRAFDAPEMMLPLEPSRLDYTNPWTAWRAGPA